MQPLDQSTPEQRVKWTYEETYGEEADATHLLGCFGIVAVWFMQSAVTTAMVTQSGTDILMQFGLNRSILEAVAFHEEHFGIDESKRYK